MRVLVIEDDTTLGHALREFLVEQGYAVDWLTDGEQALGAIAGQGYDLLLLDLNLPGQSGLDILRKLRARSAEHTSELQSLMRISYAVFCLKKHQQLGADKRPKIRPTVPR